MTVSLDASYRPSPDVVARDIEGELIIVPIASGIGDLEDELYTLNETGRSIWDKLDGKMTLSQVIQSLSEEFQALPGEIEADVLGLIEELVKRKIVIEG